MFGMNDEPAHIIRAQGVVRGDFSDPYITDGVPGEQYNCVFWLGQTADCMDLTWQPDGTVQSSPTNNYPPLFHLIAGIPSIFFGGLFGVYLMRIWLAAVCVAILAWAIKLLLDRSPTRWALLGVSVGCTPMAIFCMSGVAPSGLTFASAAVLWASGLNVFNPSSSTIRRQSQMTFIAASLLFPFLRRDAFLWEVLILFCLLSMVSFAHLKQLSKLRSTWVTMFGIFASMFAVWTIWASKATDSFVSNASSHFGDSWESGIGQLYSYILMLIGNFGWNSTWMSSEMFVVCMVTFCAVLLIALTSSNRNFTRGLLVTIALFFLSPLAIGAVRSNYIQGRYLFPLWIGVFILAGQAIHKNFFPKVFERRFFKLVIGLEIVYQFFAFAQNQRRYTVGASGTWKFLGRSDVWHPPMMNNWFVLVLIIFSLSAVLFFGHKLTKEFAPIFDIQEKSGFSKPAPNESIS
jgi:hypothetical protein